MLELLLCYDNIDINIQNIVSDLILFCNNVHYYIICVGDSMVILLCTMHPITVMKQLLCDDNIDINIQNEVCSITLFCNDLYYDIIFVDRTVGLLFTLHPFKVVKR